MALYLLIVFELAAIALVWSCFCRASFTSKANTKRPVRWAFTLLGVVGCLACYAPWYGYQPDGMAVGLIGALALIQLVTAHHWRAGVPPPFRKE